MSNITEIDGAEIDRLRGTLRLSRREMAERLGMSLRNFERLIGRPRSGEPKKPSARVVEIIDQMRKEEGL